MVVESVCATASSTNLLLLSRLPTNNTTLPLSAQVEAGKPNLGGEIRPDLVAFVQQQQRGESA